MPGGEGTSAHPAARDASRSRPASGTLLEAQSHGEPEQRQRTARSTRAATTRTSIALGFYARRASRSGGKTRRIQLSSCAAAISTSTASRGDRRRSNNEALRQALLPAGIRVDEEEYGRFYLAYADREGSAHALERHRHSLDASRWEALARSKAEVFEALIRASLLPGRAGAGAVPRRGSALAIASGACARDRAILAAGRLREPSPTSWGRRRSRGKPDPEPILTALARLARGAGGCIGGLLVSRTRWRGSFGPRRGDEGGGSDPHLSRRTLWPPQHVVDGLAALDRGAARLFHLEPR